MKIPIYQVDAFAEGLFKGNPAAVCPLESWLEEDLMQQIAAENNLAETAFIVKENDQYHIRWFTPEVEVALCGHATLATAQVLFTEFARDSDSIQFYSHRSGPLEVRRRSDGLLELDFPSDPPAKIAENRAINEALGKSPIRTLKGKTDYLLIFESQKDIERLAPNFYVLGKVPARGIIVSAPGEAVDFVSRFFAPGSGIAEDPVTGSAHTTLIPYWAGELGKNQLSARQLSSRGGALVCEYLGERVKIAGKAVPYMVGEIHLP